MPGLQWRLDGNNIMRGTSAELGKQRRTSLSGQSRRVFSAGGWWLWFESKLQRLPVSVSGRCHQMSASSRVKWLSGSDRSSVGVCFGLIWAYCEWHFTVHLPMIEICEQVFWVTAWIGLKNNSLQIASLLPPVGLKAGLEKVWQLWVWIHGVSWQLWWQTIATAVSVVPGTSHL